MPFSPIFVPNSMAEGRGALQGGAGDHLQAGGRDRGGFRRAGAEFLRPKTISGSPTTMNWQRPARRRSIATAMAWPRCASSAARRRSTSSSSKPASQVFGLEDTILYSSCFDANGGLFETLLSEEDAIISDALNHASIIDGVRLSKAKRFAMPTTTWPLSRRS